MADFPREIWAWDHKQEPDYRWGSWVEIPPGDKVLSARYIRADISDEVLAALRWAADRLDVDDGMTDKEQKTTARRLLAAIAKAEPTK